MPMPEVAKTENSGRVTYKPVIAKVSSHSKYNAPGSIQRFGLEGITGFWSLAPHIIDAMSDAEVAVKNPPPIGTVALWTLQTAPKKGPNAKPGSLYEDVIKVEPVPLGLGMPKPETVEELPWDADEAVNDPNWPKKPGEIGPDDPVPAIWTLPSKWHTEQKRIERESIERQVVFKQDGELLAAYIAHPGVWAEKDGIPVDVFGLILNRYIGLGQLLMHHETFGLYEPPTLEEKA